MQATQLTSRSQCVLLRPAVAVPLGVCTWSPRRCVHVAAALPVPPKPQQGRRAPAQTWGTPKPAKQAARVASQKQVSTSTSSKQPGKRQGGGNNQPDDDKDKQPGWGVFDPARFSADWQVPWGWGTTIGGMVLWFLSFVAVGILVVPGLYKYGGQDLATMSSSSRATFTLVCQIAETVVGLAVIRVVTAKSMKQQETERLEAEQASSGSKTASSSSKALATATNNPPITPAPLFNFSPKAPFTAPYGWGTWALGGVLFSPVVMASTALLVSLFDYEENVGGKGTVDSVVGMIAPDMPTYASLIVVTGVLAPILEETVFRGFLLPSLASRMPTWAAVVLSSVAFGVGHLSARDLPQLCALGCLLGVSYVRSRNLLTPIIIHGVWNSAVLSLLFGLAASGLDVEQVLRDM